MQNQKGFVKVLVAIIAVVTLIGFYDTSYAVPAAPSSICEATADVLKSEKATGSKKEYYSVLLKILNISTLQKEQNMACEKLYAVNSEQKTILNLSEYNKRPIKVGQKIKTKMQFGGDEWFNGVFLTDISILTVSSKSSSSSVISKENKISTKLKNFNVYYSFGIDGAQQNILDTKNNSYVKDMVCESSKQYSVELTQKQKKAIYDSVISNNLMNFKNDFTENCDKKGICSSVSPLGIATLEISLNGKTKTINYKEDYANKKDKNFKKFLAVKKAIEKIISEIEKENNIEQPENCAYL